MEKKIRIRKLPPVWLVRSIDLFRSGLLRLNRRLFPASVVLYEQFQSLWLLPAIKVAAELNIAGLLKEQSRSAKELSLLTNTHEGNLYRLLRALASQGIFREGKDHTFCNTSLSLPLIDDTEGSLRHMILHHVGEINWNALGQLSLAVKSGKDAFSQLHGKKIYEYLKENKEESGRFDRSMTNLSQLAIEPILSVFNFSPYPLIADIGGGEGLLLSSILYKHKNIHGLLFDLPEGLNHSDEIIRNYAVEERMKTITGSFFDDKIPQADLYLLKNILHNWGDEECVAILSNIRKSMPEKGQILVLEMILSEDNSFSYGKLIDIQMMALMSQGKERTRKEYELLFEKAVLKLEKIIHTIAPLSIMAAVKKH